MPGAHEREGAQRRVDVRCINTTLTELEETELRSWVAAHPFDEIDYISIAARAVSVRGSHPYKNIGAAAIAVRHHGRLSDALNEAIARLHNAP
jgi:hypothetical protein